MKNIFLPVFSLFSFFSYAQDKTYREDQIIGSWMSDDCVHTVYSFYKDHTYQAVWVRQVHSYGTYSDTMLERGSWELSCNNTCILVTEKGYKPEKKDIVLLNESNLTVSSRVPLPFHRRHTEQLTRIPAVPKQDTIPATPVISVYLVNIYDSSRKVLLNADADLEITSIDTSGQGVDYSETNSHCHISDLTDSTVTLAVWYQTKTINYRNRQTEENRVEYRHLTPYTVSLRNIQSFSYNNPKKERLGMIGGTCIGIGLGTSLVIAPLVSINYRNWSFNEKRYYKLAGIGLCTFTIGIPLALVSPSRQYSITYPGNKGDTGSWYLVKP